MNGILAKVLPVYSAILEPFRSPDFGPKLATWLLVLALLFFLCFLLVSLRQAFGLRAALLTITGKNALKDEKERRHKFQTDYHSINLVLLSNRTISAAWQEFRKTLIFKGNQSTPVVFASVRPSAFFNPRGLLVQYDFVRSVPNYFVGLGLLGTFIGLIAALTFSTKSLTEAVDQNTIKEALNQLLTTAAAKFYISAAGLVASLVLSLLIRLVRRQMI
jgi:hypothetical protein